MEIFPQSTITQLWNLITSVIGENMLIVIGVVGLALGIGYIVDLFRHKTDDITNDSFDEFDDEIMDDDDWQAELDRQEEWDREEAEERSKHSTAYNNGFNDRDW